MGRKITYKVGLENFNEYKEQVEGTEQEITVEVHDLDADPWSVDDKHRLVGTDIPRVDGPAKVTGAAKYAYDINRPKLAYAGVVASPHSHAKVTSVDLTAAKAIPGVLATRAFEGRHIKSPGTFVAAICADSPNALDDALQAVKVVYDVQPTAVTVEDALKKEAPRVSGGSNDVAPRRPMRRGDAPDKALESAEIKVSGTYRTAIQTHSCLEPHGSTVEISPEGEAVVWASTQATGSWVRARGSFFEALGVGRGKTRAITDFMGGGFGSKFGPGPWDVISAEFARETKRPVKFLLPRRLEHLQGGNRPDSIQELTLGGNKDGMFTVLKGETWGTAGNGGGGAGCANFIAYRYPAVEMAQHTVKTFTARAAAFRAPRHPQGSFAMESLIDRFATEAGLDPLDVRLKNDPHPIRQVQWRIGADRMDWKQKRAAYKGQKGPRVRGVGCAAARWSNAGRGRWRVNLRIGPDGRVSLFNAVQDIGTGIKTVLAIMVAEELGLPVSAIDVKVGDTAHPPGPGSGGSTTTPSIAPAARAAAVQARKEIAQLLAKEWDVEIDAITWKDGAYQAGDKRADFVKACALLDDEALDVTGQRQPNWEGPYRETAGCQFAEVEVDKETGVIKVDRVVAIHDCGKVIDTLTARNQVNGGVIQGISYALFEERRMDRNLGDMVNPTFDTYKILGAKDCPQIDVVMTSVISGFNNAGIMGLGEPATVPTAAAVANAVYHALGVQVPELPMTPARVLSALRKG